MSIKEKIRKIRVEVRALYYALKDPRTPWYARFFGAAVIAYALSPIDLIPDFIPVIGMLDDIIIVPLGILLVIKMIPAAVFEDARRKSAEVEESELPKSRLGAAIIIAIWLVLLVLAAYFAFYVL
jgi:uncharacterized membrane protein YkvA (DUF1232 family)